MAGDVGDRNPGRGTGRDPAPEDERSAAVTSCNDLLHGEIYPEPKKLKKSLTEFISG